MNLGEIKLETQRLFGDTAGAQILAADLVAWANNAQMDINRKTEALKITGNISMVASTDSYALPADFLKLERTTLDGYKLQIITLEELDKYSPDRASENPVGVPIKCYIWGSKIYLYPAPQAAGVNNLVLWYIRTPVALANDADIPEIPVQYHELIVRYCLMRAKEVNDDMDGALRIRQEYDNWVGIAASEIQFPRSDTYPSVRSLPGDDY